MASTSDAHEQERHVALDVAGLDVLQEATGGAGRSGDAVHRAVDHALVEEVDDLRQARAVTVPAPFTTASRTCWLNQYTAADSRSRTG